MIKYRCLEMITILQEWRIISYMYQWTADLLHIKNTSRVFSEKFIDIEKKCKDEKRIHLYKKNRIKIFLLHKSLGEKASSGVGSYHLGCWDLLQSHKFSKITLDVSSRWIKICYGLQLFVLKEFISVFCALRYLGQF